MESTIEKVLILTLGKGRPRPYPSVEDRFVSNEYSYDEKEYTPKFNVDAQNQMVRTEFVAEPLVRIEKPNQIFIIGTVNSQWADFYRKFVKNKEIDKEKKFEHFCTLLEIENTYGNDTKADDLKRIAADIESIYNEDEVFQSLYSSDEPSVKISILLTKVGMDEDELKFNYGIISSIEDYFKKDIHKKYRVSFDITHAFRSTPIYGLVIINYLKHITQCDVKISHLYYGNIEAHSTEAYIVDLKAAIRVLELTNGVSEFRDTGNAVALLRELEFSGSEEALRTTYALEKFDWATQINDYQAIIDSVRNLRKVVNETPETKSRYTDLRDMLNMVLNEQFGSMLKLKEDDPDDVAKIQLCISQWYQSQNRYGLAIATALEALRSYLVTFYLRFGEELDAEIKLEDCRNEIYRKAALDRLTHLAESDLSSCVKEGKTKDISEELDLLCKIEKLRVPAKTIRDCFAHNLSPDQNEEDEKRKTFVPNSDDKGTINEFIGALDELFNSPKEKIAKAYCLRTKKKKSSKDGGTRLIICRADEYENGYRGLWEYGLLKKNSSNRKRFEVCFINRDLAEKLSGSQDKNELISAARLLVLLIEENFGLGKDDLEHLNVVLAGLESHQCLLLSTVLKKNNIKVSQCQYNNNLPVSLQDMTSHETEEVSEPVEPDENDIKVYKEMKAKWETSKKKEKPYYEFCDLFRFLESK